MEGTFHHELRLASDVNAGNVTVFALALEGDPYSDAVVVGSESGNVTIFDRASGKIRQSLAVNIPSASSKIAINALSLHDTMPILLSGCEGGFLRAHDEREPHPCFSAFVHQEKCPITGISMDPSGLSFSSAGQDGMIHMWDMRTWRRTRSIATGHGMFMGETILDMAFHARLKIICSAGADGNFRIYKD